ncbi:M50 family metallopeptidase [Caproiciproducens galactitolivorans]|uniref:Site-2 protease family protein n=1 Tax=Caproiciproducens galactitolivorans TaxID=642589 RepID=A0ABT4BSC1_9FIRM|nr:site-2 protease family protein [Caproiciproducens galactitolivorans]MCY1713215.1 site-2 protease family protein [Caproiciproducens galactitolivorans]
MIIAVLLFSFIIFIHEFGHFFTAKLSGIRVNEFAIGMGPKLWHVQKGETTYSLRAFPIGGFCAMEGEDEDSADDHAFNNRPVWKRILVVVMGAVMNIILGIVLMMILLGKQPAFSSTTIAKFTDHSAFQAAGLQVGDRFKNIDGYDINGDRDLSFALSIMNPSKTTIQVIRNGKLLTFDNVKLNTREVNGKKALVTDFYVAPIEKNPITLVQKSVQDTVSTVRLVWFSLVGMVTGKFGMKDVAGPVGAASMIGQAASIGLKQSFLAALNNIIMMMMLITVNLGVVNLLPLPALDGGRLLFLIVEGIRRKPINPKYEGLVNTAGFCLLMGLMVLVTFNDIVRLVTGKGLGA